MTRRLLCAACLLSVLLAPTLSSQQVASAAPTAQQIRSAATDIMKRARYCTLVSIGLDGQPQARIVDPSIGAGNAIWIATNPLTRKVQEIRRDSRVTLLFFNAAANEYVTVLGNAEIVTDSATKAAHWKPEWGPFYKEQFRGPDFMMIRVRPFRLEVSSSRHQLVNDSLTWRPIILNLP
jgi:general stress protein 26